MGSISGTTTEQAKNPLKVLIVGAGISGLTAAIALRKQGHDVHIFEQSRLARETGAALHLAPNANGILRRLGIFAEKFGANPIERFTEYTAAGEEIRSLDLRESNKQWQHPWLLAHRTDLHNSLLRTATTSDDGSKASQLKTSSRVIKINPESAIITLEDSTEIQGDLILGADGVHSMTRKYIEGHIEPFCSGKSAFRFLVPTKAALDDTITRKFVERHGELCVWFGTDRRIVMYPTSDNTILNFVCIHPEVESAAEANADWGQLAGMDKMLEIFKSFDPAILRLLSKADPQTVKVWKLLDMAVLPSWCSGHLALLGDAAHPFLPHQGQGAGVAIEDAASLAVALPLGTPRNEIPERLRLYQEIRYERASKIQQFSRIIGQDQKDDAQVDMYAFTNYNFGHDEWDNSSQKLREWTWKRIPKVYWRMPTAFGPMPGPRQDTNGMARDGTKSTFITASIKFKTSRTLLQNLFPPMRRGWRFSAPGTVAFASFTQTTLNKMEWLGGSGYNLIGLYIHGVEYMKEDGTIVKGSYMPVLFESLADPIVTGREELGMPKLYSTIDIYRQATSYRIRTGWQGASWGDFLLEDLVEVDSSSGARSINGEGDNGILSYRYIPQVGRKNKGLAAEEYPIFDPFCEAVPKPAPHTVYKAGKATFRIDPLNWEQLPTLHHIILRLSELPIYEIVDASVIEGSNVPDVSAAIGIE